MFFTLGHVLLLHTYPVSAAHMLRSNSRSLSELSYFTVSSIADLPLGVLDSQEDTVGYSWVEGVFWVLERRKGG